MTEDQTNVKLADEPPIVRIAHTIIQQAIKDRAAEIHVDFFDEETRVRFLIDGAMHEVMKLPPHIHPPLVARYKEMAEMTSRSRVGRRSAVSGSVTRAGITISRCAPNPRQTARRSRSVSRPGSHRGL